jgi:cobalt-zinc-cadmium efflux system outer membrane protein
MVRISSVGVWLLLVLTAAHLIAQEPAAQLTLEQALQGAFERSPDLRARRAELEEARGRLLTARTYPWNPEISIEGAARDTPEGSGTDRGIEVSQEIEIGGQRGRRSTVAQASLTGAEARFRHEERQLAGRVAVAFADAVRARELLRIEETDAALASDLLQLEEKRLEAGAGTQIELNLARAAAGRSSRRVALARGSYSEARSVLAETIGLAPAAPPEPAGDLTFGFVPLPPLGELVRTAVENRADLAALRNFEEASRAQVALEKSLALPNLVLRAFQNREGSTDDIAGGGLALGIPLFNRNRGSIAEARAAADRAAAETAVGRLLVEREVATAFAAYQAANAASEGLRAQVIGNLAENLSLLQRSFEEGKISRGDLFLFRRELVDSQRDYLDATAQAWQARVRLDLAAGRFPLSMQPNRSPEP